MQEEKGTKVKPKQTPKDELKKSLTELRDVLTEPLPGMVPNIMGVQMLKAGFIKTEDLTIIDAFSTYNFNLGMTRFHLTLVDLGSGERRGVDFNLEPSESKKLTEFLEQYPIPRAVRYTVSLGIVADPVREEAKPFEEEET